MISSAAVSYLHGEIARSPFMESDMQKTILTALISLAALAGCSPSAPAADAPVAQPAAAPTAKADMSVPAAPESAQIIAGRGKVTAIDAAAGTVTIDHEGVPEVKWEASSMAFTAINPMILENLKVGDAVAFELKSAAEPTIITQIATQ